MKTIPFHALFAEDNVNPNEHLPCHPTKLLEATDVLLAQDVTSGQQSLVYGRSVLEQIVAGQLVDGLEVLAVELDMDTDELERLIALSRVVKGRDDYQAAG